MQQVWTEEFRPTKFDDVVGNTARRKELEILGLNKHNLRHLLLFGPPGCGKTTSVHCLVNQVYGKTRKGQVLILNAAKDR